MPVFSWDYSNHANRNLMPKSIEKLLLFFSDLFAIILAFVIWATLRENFGYPSYLPFSEVIFISGLVYCYWFLFFLFFGLYRSWYAQSRFDEFVSLLKTISIGVLLIFILTLDLRQDINNPVPISRVMILSYWLIMLGSVSFGRISLRTLQRKFLERGIGLRNTIIIGDGEKALELFRKVKAYPALGYRIIGLVPFQTDPEEDKKTESNVSILGDFSNLENIIQSHQIEEVLIALGEKERHKVVDVLGCCNGLKVNLKIVPDLYDIVVGQVRTNQIYGFPLIEIFPELMPAWERSIKRLIDILFSLIAMFLFLPLWILIAIIIKIDSLGSVFYNQKRVGRDGKIFQVRKFRSMYYDAELMTGPVWANKNDARITRFGRLLRKGRIDEVPQLINVLKGEMSLIGPRPERPYFVEELKKEIPYYTRRLRVRPGITGWAQIKHEYDSSMEDVRKKLQYDFYYLENMSLRMDLKIILNTIYIIFSGKGN